MSPWPDRVHDILTVALDLLQVTGRSTWSLGPEDEAQLLPTLDPYDNPLYMPLSEFVGHPIAQELLHNGQAFLEGPSR